MISRYLDSLSSELRVPRRARARILAETRDHLEQSVAAGRSQSEAVAAFGEPAELATSFHEQLASSSARRASVWTSGLSAMFLVGLAAAVLGPANAFPVGVVVFLGAQLGIVAAVLGFVRLLRYRDGVPASRLGDMWRTNLLVVACVAVVSLAELVDGGAALTIGGAVMLTLSVVVGVGVVRSIQRARIVRADASPDDALDDFRALVPPLDSLLRRLQSFLRARPWLFCGVFAAACGVALAAQHNVTEGGIAISWRPLLAAVVIASIEAGAIFACFATFGRFLGIRR